MTDVTGGPPRGSTARQAFDDARAVLHDHRIEDRRSRPAITYRLDERSGPGPSDVDAHGVARSPDTGLGPIHAAVDATTSGKISARELVEESLLAAAARAEELGAMAEVRADEALAEADRLDDRHAAGDELGPLHGVPVTVKDVIDVAGMTTRAGSAAYVDVPDRDAIAVARLRAAGAVVIGKASTHEFALGVTSPTTFNPNDPTRLAGGSSGGSAVAVATGMGLASLGTDTRASIRVPAALTGVVGLKPTFGRVPTDGVVSLSWTMDHVATMATTVADAALVLEVLAADGSSFVPACSRGVDGLRVGTAVAAFDGAEPRLTAVVEAGIDRLADAGASVEVLASPSLDDFELANAAGLIVSRCEAATFHRALGLDRSLYWDEVGDQLDLAEGVAAVDYLDAQRARLDLRHRMSQVFGAVDLLVMPTVPVTAPLVSDFARYLMVLSRNAIPWSFIGFPAISVPCGMVDGLPVGLQLVAPPWREDLVLAAAAVVERATAG